MRASSKPCSFATCEKPQHSGGHCKMHYTRIQRHGDPNIRLKNNHPKPIEEVLAGYVPNRPAGECWIWHGAKDGKGYGQINRQGKVRRAHRFVYEFLVGPIPGGQLLMHSCDNGMCVNPEHLTPGTDAENIRDCVRKRRNTYGERNWNAKLTESQVMEARRKYASGRYSVADLAREYDLVSMRLLLTGRTWKHLPLIERAS